MRLIVAEKPSVAQAIAQALHITNKKGGYIEGETDIVTWCIGHLIELAPADYYNPEYSIWSLHQLPIIPDKWAFCISEGTRKQYDTVAKLMNDSRVLEVVCATDAGREGELIFRLVYEKCKCQKPMKRLWISSMEEIAIIEGFTQLKDGAAYDTLYQAALCRSKADWLVGMNGTRLFSLTQNKTINVGRVVTPTLALLTEREEEIKSFQKEKYYTLLIDCGTFTATSDKLTSKKDAEEALKKCSGKNAEVVTKEEKYKNVNPPKLYDLTSLQRDANRLYGYTAQQTLDYLQSLYEKKYITYPRTDSQYLTSNMKNTILPLAKMTIGILLFLEGIICPNQWENVIDNNKVTDHHAIIPTKSMTQEIYQNLPTGERNIYTLLSVRFLCALGEPQRILEVMAYLKCEKISFTAKGKTIQQAGWKVIENAFLKTFREKNQQESYLLPELEKGQTFKNVIIKRVDCTTSPPPHFTEDTLLSAMDNVEAKEFAEIQGLERKGLGTSATRAAMIEKLIKNSLAERKAATKGKTKYLIPTEKGFSIIKTLPDTIKSARLTAEWETKLKRIENGELDTNTFLSDIENYVRRIVVDFRGEKAEQDFIGNCPFCGKRIFENNRSYYCESYQKGTFCGFTLWKENRFFQTFQKELTKEMAVELLKNGKVFIKGLFSKKKQKHFDAYITLTQKENEAGKKQSLFQLEFIKKE